MDNENDLESKLRGGGSARGPPRRSEAVGLETDLNKFRSKVLQELYPTLESRAEQWRVTRGLSLLADLSDAKPMNPDDVFSWQFKTVGELYLITEHEIHYDGCRLFTKAAWFGLNEILKYYGLPSISLPYEFLTGKRRPLRTTGEILQTKSISPELQAILTTPLTLDTPLENFYLVAGWGGHNESSIYKNASINLKREIDNYAYLKGRVPYNADGRFFNSIYHYNKSHSWCIKTLGDIKSLFEEWGIIGGMGLKAVAYFNKTLEEHGLEPFRLRAVGYSPYDLRRLEKHGIKPV